MTLLFFFFLREIAKLAHNTNLSIRSDLHSKPFSPLSSVYVLHSMYTCIYACCLHLFFDQQAEEKGRIGGLDLILSGSCALLIFGSERWYLFC